MSATQKELREAYKRGLRMGFYHEPDAERLAREAYPAKLVTRPREMESCGFTYRLIEGRVEWKPVGDAAWGVKMISGVVAIVRDLLAHPTETVEEDEE
jgi:hypothetical protein